MKPYLSNTQKHKRACRRVKMFLQVLPRRPKRLKHVSLSQDSKTTIHEIDQVEECSNLLGWSRGFVSINEFSHKGPPIETRHTKLTPPMHPYLAPVFQIWDSSRCHVCLIIPPRSPRLWLLRNSFLTPETCLNCV